MKKLFCFLAVAATAGFTSCSSDDDSTTNPPADQVTSITLTSNVESIVLGEGSFTFSVADQEGNALTDATLTANDVAITSPWTPAEAGTFEIEATYGDLTDNITVTVTEATIEASDSFVIDNTSYETSEGAFVYRGIFAAETEGEYIIIWDFNPYLMEGEGQTATYPNDLYIRLVAPIEPTGTDPQTNEPTFTIQYPTTGSFAWEAEIIDVIIFANNSELLPSDITERAAAISDATLDITALEFAQEEGGASNLEATYTITLANDTVINGEYSGETGIYDGTTGGRGINVKNVPLTKGAVGLKK